MRSHPAVLRYPPFWWAIGGAFFFVAVVLFSVSLIILVDGLVALVLAWLLIGLFGCFVAWTAIHAGLRLRRDGVRAMLPLCVAGSSLLGILVLQSSDLPLQIDFAAQRAQREAIVAQVRAGTLKPNVSYNPDLISLPLSEAHFSEGGEISVSKVGGVLIIYFYTWRGILDNFSTYIYRSDPTDLRAHAVYGTVVVNGDRFSNVQRLASHWFWGVSS